MPSVMELKTQVYSNISDLHLDFIFFLNELWV